MLSMTEFQIRNWQAPTQPRNYDYMHKLKINERATLRDFGGDSKRALLYLAAQRFGYRISTHREGTSMIVIRIA